MNNFSLIKKIITKRVKLLALPFYIFLRKLLKINAARNNLTIFNDDVFIVSYARSGNTWLRFLLGNLLFKKKIDFINMDNIVPDIYKKSDNDLKKIKRPRYIKSHNLFDIRYPKVIYIVRNPKDVLISCYYYYLKFNPNEKKVSFNNFYKEFMNNGVGDFGTWGNNVGSWLINREYIKNGFHLCYYEELLKNTNHEIKKILKFLNLDISSSRILKAIDYASLKNMREIETKNFKLSKLLNKTENKIPFIRANKYNAKSIKITLTNNQINQLKHKFKNTLKLLKY
jgi:hypothetical protein